MTYIKNANIVCENGIIWDGVISIKDGIIEKIFRKDEIVFDENAEVIDAQGAYVGPGFVDIHVHGGDKYMFHSNPAEAAKFFLQHGETTVLATLYYNLPKDEFLKSIDRVKSVMQTPEGKTIAGFYMEGPYMNPKYGASPELNAWKGEIKADDYKLLADKAEDKVKVWAVAPERDGIEPFMRYAKSVNPDVVFAVGHSEATPRQVKALKKYGVNIMTHCMNATGRNSEWVGTRGCGPDEACLADDSMYAELICDSQGIHVNPSLLNMVIKIKGIEKIILITDSFVSDEKSPESLSHIDDLSFDANGLLSGSRLTMDRVCRNFMQNTGCGITQAFLAASTNPAKAIGMDSEIGSIESGKKANLVFVDDKFNVEKVMFEGKLC